MCIAQSGARGANQSGIYHSHSAPQSLTRQKGWHGTSLPIADAGGLHVWVIYFFALEGEGHVLCKQEAFARQEMT